MSTKVRYRILALLHYFPKLRGIKALIHWSEIALHAVITVMIFEWASSQGIAAEVFALWFWPLIFCGFFNSVRFVAEHYGTPWNASQLAGTRTIISNPVSCSGTTLIITSGITYTLRYLGTTLRNCMCYCCRKLTARMPLSKKAISRFFDAKVNGPESVKRNIVRNEKRNAATAISDSPSTSNGTSVNNEPA